MWAFQAYLTSSSYTGTAVNPSWCDELCVFTLLSMLSTSDKVEEDRVAFWSNLWASLWVTCRPYQTNKPLTRLFLATFTHTFTRTLALTWPDVLFIVHAKDSAFTMARTGSYTIFLLPLQYKNVLGLAIVGTNLLECIKIFQKIFHMESILGGLHYSIFFPQTGCW